MNHPPLYIAILGQTGSGKSAFAMDLASKIDGEIIICDSVQIYQGFDIGSAKPSKEDQQKIPHHLVDCVHPHDHFDASTYQRLAREAILEIRSRNRMPIVVGGTGLYYRALEGAAFHDLPTDPLLKEQLFKRTEASLWKELQIRWPEKAQTLHPHDHFRVRRAIEIITLHGKIPDLKPQVLWSPKECYFLDHAKEVLEERIRKRTQDMLDQGLIQEVEKLLAQGVSPKSKPMNSIGYRQVLEYQQGLFSLTELKEQIIIATRQYAKRQRTWFRDLNHKK